MAYYEHSMSVRLSKNYNSVEMKATYGRDSLPNEKLDAQTAAVEGVVQNRMEELIKQADALLGQSKTDDFKSKKGK